MTKIREDKIREHRIDMEIVVDTYSGEEQAMGWYCYLEDQLTFPFKAKCVKERSISPLDKGDVVEVIEMPSSDECEHEMFVNVKFQDDTLSVPLSQLESLKANKKTQQAIEDWHYWINRGYQF